MNQLNFLQSLGWALFNSLWQMAILWLAYQLLVKIYPRLKASVKTTTAISLTITGFLWFVYTFFKSLLSDTNPFPIIGGSSIIQASLWDKISGYIFPVASIIYLIVLIVPVWQLIRNYRYVQAIRNKGLKKIDAGWRIFVRNTAASMGIVRKVQVWLSEFVSSPVTIGYLKPIILIPVAAINNLTPQQLEAIILHELSHIHRYDYLFNLIISFVRTILYFNPFVKLLVKAIEKERENSCDALVLQHQYKPGEYASALLRLEQNHRSQMMLAASGADHDLLSRIESIMGIQRKKKFNVRRLAFATATLFTVALLNIFVAVKHANTEKNYFALNNEISPYYFFNGNPVVEKNYFPAATPSSINNIDKDIVQVTRINKYETEIPESSFNFELAEPDPAAGYMHVGYTTPVIPELNKNDQEQLTLAIKATKKILEEKEWKELEKSYADAFNSSEKVRMKYEYQHQLDKVDWTKLENQLKISYNQINWDKVNDQIETSLAQIKLDSMQQQLNVNLQNLVTIEGLLKANDVTCIPDSEISLESLKAYQDKVKARLEKINAIKDRKVIKL